MLDYREIQGEYTTVKSVTVTLPQYKLVDAVLDIFYERYPKFVGNYIDKNNTWQMYEGDNHHNGNPEYSEGNLATKDELQLNEYHTFICTLRY